jgi:hypothetical protein
MALEERYIEWLERLEIPIEETATIEDLQAYLREEFGFGDAQIEALSSAAVARYEVLPEYGITPHIIEYPWGEEVRFTVEGYRGFFGFDFVKAVLEAVGYY